MESSNSTGYIAVTVAGAYPRHTLMAFNRTSGKFEAATASSAGKDIMGTLTQESFADGDKRTVKLLSAPGTKIGIAAVAIALGNTLEAAAAGTISNTGSGVVLGTPLETAAAGEYFEWLPFQVPAVGAA